MTPRQAQLLSFLTQFWANNGFAPSFAEIADAMEISPSNAVEIARRVEERGYIRRLPGKHRNLVVLKDF